MERTQNFFNYLEVTDIKINKENVTIKVKLPDNDGMGDAFSYPKAIIKFNKKPHNIKIIHEH